ncbi:hypothetical protein AC579_6319 [Pseudocercospora musae]|uniref:Uncharacterized protein n=1 Tax=Pseudocercospora musae TaxID=113226 RepID=A0A139IP25_9PEZI|nr:hypothetical protein AC579_6319 [Pseudocercospora musae]
MAKSQGHERIASRKAKKAHQQAKAKRAAAWKQWTREAPWRDSKESKATFQLLINTFELLENRLASRSSRPLSGHKGYARSSCLRLMNANPLWKVNRSRVESYDRPIEVLKGGQQDYIDRIVHRRS